jgi:hypothetical protein
MWYFRSGARFREWAAAKEKGNSSLPVEGTVTLFSQQSGKLFPLAQEI